MTAAASSGPLSCAHGRPDGPSPRCWVVTVIATPKLGWLWKSSSFIPGRHSSSPGLGQSTWPAAGDKLSTWKTDTHPKLILHPRGPPASGISTSLPSRWILSFLSRRLSCFSRDGTAIGLPQGQTGPHLGMSADWLQGVLYLGIVKGWSVLDNSLPSATQNAHYMWAMWTEPQSSMMLLRNE